MDFKDVISVLRRVLGDRYVRDESYEIWAYTGNMLPRCPMCIARPGDTSEVRHIVELANRERIPIIPRGLASRAVTGGEGTYPPTTGGILLDMTRMNRVREVCEDTMTVTVEAGATLAEVNTALASLGYRVIEGTLCPFCATAGSLIGYGPGDLKYGNRAEQVMDVEVVLASGEVLTTGSAGYGWGHISKYVGYNLTGLFLEARGTLGVVTAVTFAMYKLPETISFVDYAFSDTDGLVSFVRSIQRDGITHLPALYEIYMWPEATFKLYKNRPQICEQNEAWMSLMNGMPPFPSDVIGITLEGTEEQVAAQIVRLDAMARKCDGRGIGIEPARDHYVDRNWEGNTKYCEDASGISTSWSEPGFRCRIDQYPLFLNLTQQIAEELGFCVGDRYWRGARVGARTISNFPVIMFDDTDPTDRARAHEFHRRVFESVLKYGGSRSVGAVMGPVGSGAQWTVERDIKRMLDPNSIMFPGLV